MLDMANVTGKIRQTSTAHPELPFDIPQNGFFDTGGAAFQSEPMQQFMKFVIYNWQSPYWNPYVAAGSLGPETLVDDKFSPFTLIVALLGGSSIAFHFVLLSLYILAIYFLIRLITVYFRLSFLSAVVAAVVYLLNGYSVANIASNVSQSYLYFPILLFALCAFSKKPSYWRFLGLVLANIPILLTTFLPTSFLIMMSVYLIAFGFSFNTYPRWKNRLVIIALQISSALVAFLLLAFLWFPVLEGAKVLKLFQMYNARTFLPASLAAFLSFFTPKHFWESYNSTPYNVMLFEGNRIFHFGIVASLILVQVFTQKKNFKNWIIVILLILSLLVLGRIFAISGIYQFLATMPQIKNIGEQYLWIVVAISFTLLSAFGMESLKAKNNFKIPLLATYVLIFGLIFYLVFRFLSQASYYFVDFGVSKYYLVMIFYLGILLFLLLFSAFIFYFISAKPTKILFFKSILILLAFLELFFYMNTLRYKREDIFSNPPPYVAFLKENIGDNRVANYTWGFMPDLGAAYQIQQLETLNYALPWYKKFYERNFLNQTDRWGDFSLVLGQKDEPNIHEEILDMLSVKYILTDKYRFKYKNYFQTRNYPLVFQDGERYIFENKDIFPRAMAITSLIKAPLTADTQGHSLREVVFTEDEKLLSEAKKVGISSDSTRFNANEADHVSIVSYENAKVVLKAKLATPAVVALTDNWHPNWKAYANGREVYVGQINESFRGIVLPAGEYKIEFRYQPKILTFALWVSSVVFLFLMLMTIFHKKIEHWFAKFARAEETTSASPEVLLKDPSFCVIIPMYNEEKNVQKCVETIDNFLKKIKNKTAIVAINDGSSDNTLDVLNKVSKKIKRLQIVNHVKNKGYGAANVSGAKFALKDGFDYVLFMDADLTQNVSYIKAFVKEMEKGTDYIKATRYSGGGGTKDVPWSRRVVSRVGNILAKVFFRLPLSDYTNGFRAVKTKILSQLHAREKGFSYLIEEVYQVSKIAQSYAEVPYILTARKGKFSKSKFNYSPKVYFDYLKYLFKR